MEILYIETETRGDYAMRNYKFVYISLQQTFPARLYFQLSTKLILELFFLENMLKFSCSSHYDNAVF